MSLTKKTREYFMDKIEEYNEQQQEGGR